MYVFLFLAQIMTWNFKVLLILMESFYYYYLFKCEFRISESCMSINFELRKFELGSYWIIAEESF